MASASCLAVGSLPLSSAGSLGWNLVFRDTDGVGLGERRCDASPMSRAPTAPSIPAWGSAPGIQERDARGLKARPISGATSPPMNRAFSPNAHSNRVFLGRCPRLAWMRAFGPPVATSVALHTPFEIEGDQCLERVRFHGCFFPLGTIRRMAVVAVRVCIWRMAISLRRFSRSLCGKAM